MVPAVFCKDTLFILTVCSVENTSEVPCVHRRARQTGRKVYTEASNVPKRICHSFVQEKCKEENSFVKCRELVCLLCTVLLSEGD